MSDQTIAFALLCSAALVLWATAFFIYPAVGRARFSADAAEIRDEVDEAVITGDLPFDECVREWIDRAELLIEDPRILSFTKVWSVHRAHQVLGIPLGDDVPNYESLSKPQRAMMYEFDQRMIQAIARRLVTGSTLAVMLRAMQLVVRINSRFRAIMPAARPRPAELATEVYRAKDFREFQLA